MSRFAPYLFALLVAGAAALAALVLFEAQVSDQPIYAPLIGAVALAAWYGGFGPALVALVGGWGIAVLVLVEPRGGVRLGDAEDATRWWVTLAVGVVIAVVSSVLRMRQRRASGELVTTRATLGQIEAFQRLSVALSGALSSLDVARVLTSQAGEIVEADGVALGLVDDEGILLLDPTGLAAGPSVDRHRLDLSARSLLAEAARRGLLLWVDDRRSLEEQYPETTALLPESVRSGLAVPIRVADDASAGALAFLFDRDGAITVEARGLAQIIADIAGQALERARLYERERESRQALDRILQVAPRFLVADEGGVMESVCREARMTFGADYGVLWKAVGDGLELLWIDPPVEDPGSVRLSLADFPQLREAIRELGTSFVRDVRETSTGEGFAFIQRLGIRSSLRTPIVIAGETELVLSISWQGAISPPDPATLAVVRRFADQAGLALEQLERRRAEAESLERADAARRLQEVTAALSQAATPFDVSTTCLAHALRAVGAEAGFVALTGPDGTRAVELVSADGFDDDELAAWRALGLDDDVPFARAIATGEPVWALTRTEMSAFTGLAEPRSSGWISIPLPTSRGARGALHLSLRQPRELATGEREWLQAMVSQCGQALERSSLYQEEQQSRLRAERLQTMTGRLSNALTSGDVAQVVVDELAAAVDPVAIVLASVEDDEVSGLLRSHGHGDRMLAPLLERDGDTPVREALRTRRSVVVEDVGILAPTGADEAEVGLRTCLAVPLVAARRVNGVLVALWDRPHLLVAEDRAIVEALAGQAAQAFDRAERYESEQAIAETLQRSVLPDSLPRVEGVGLAARYLPGSTRLDVGGDWFDALKLSDGKLALVVGDVVGKGVQAAASMSQLRNAIRAFSVECLKPSSALARLNRLSGDVLDTSFATVVYVSLDPASGTCRMASAGHPPPVVAFPDGRVEFLESVRGLPLGTGLQRPYRQDTLELPAGSVLLLYTDGLVERRGRSIDVGLEELRSAVREGPSDPDRLLEFVLDRVVGGREREDDIAILAARVLPVAPRELDLRIPSDVDAMGLVRDAMRSWLSGTPLDRSETEALVLATWEAVANAVEHAVDPTEQIVKLRARLTDGSLRIVVEDSGAWSPPAESTNRGFGLKLIESLVTSVDVARGDGGTTITLEQALGGDASR